MKSTTVGCLCGARKSVRNYRKGPLSGIRILQYIRIKRLAGRIDLNLESSGYAERIVDLKPWS